MPTRYERILSVVLCVLLGVWLGGMVALILFVLALFKADRSLATQAAPVMFWQFAVCQIVLGTLVFSITCFTLAGKGKTSWPLLALTTGAYLCAMGVIRVTYAMEILRKIGTASHPDFARYHGYANTLYLTIFACVLAALITVLWRLSAGVSRGTSSTIPPA